ncbi:MAG: hypothetical protein HDR88_01535 [Bacteroides sp.]|nr:hypothetical protein [Bacteroides sp.]
MYGQIISFLFVLLILYYVVMILLDFRKAKTAKGAEIEKNSEEEIDISDEANTFRPILIIREDPNKSRTLVSTGDDEAKTENDSEKSVDSGNSEKSIEVNKASENESTETEQRKKSESDKHTLESPEVADFPGNKNQRVNHSALQEPEYTEKRSDEKTFCREGYREPLMTDGLEVGRFLEEAETLAATGKGSLENTIYEIHK